MKTTFITMRKGNKLLQSNNYLQWKLSKAILPRIIQALENLTYDTFLPTAICEQVNEEKKNQHARYGEGNRTKTQVQGRKKYWSNLPMLVQQK